MKILVYSLLLSTSFFAACSNSGKENTSQKTDATAVTNETKADAPAASPIQGVLNAYLGLKNALSKDNDKEAAESGKALEAALVGFDKSVLKADQSKAFADIQDDAKEHAEHIGANVGNIAHQREHFDMLSKDMYDLVKMLGAGQPLYVDHCPMYNNNKGAIWLSEVKDIKNPYLGAAMPTCGTVKEELQ